MNMKAYRGWRLSYSQKYSRYTAKGNDVQGQLKEIKADNRAEIERRVDEYLAPITFSTVKVNGVDTVISSRQHVVVNICSRLEYVEDKDTPVCCSPAHETYWSM